MFVSHAAIEPPRALALSDNAHGFEWVWQFGLCPIDGNTTRLVSRGTERIPRTAGAWLFMRVMEPAAFVMTRRMLLGVKERAEALGKSARAARSLPRSSAVTTHP